MTESKGTDSSLEDESARAAGADAEDGSRPAAAQDEPAAADDPAPPPSQTEPHAPEAAPLIAEEGVNEGVDDLVEESPEASDA